MFMKWGTVVAFWGLAAGISFLFLFFLLGTGLVLGREPPRVCLDVGGRGCLEAPHTPQAPITRRVAISGIYMCSAPSVRYTCIHRYCPGGGELPRGTICIDMTGSGRRVPMDLKFRGPPDAKFFVRNPKIDPTPPLSAPIRLYPAPSGRRMPYSVDIRAVPLPTSLVWRLPDVRCSKGNRYRHIEE